MHQVHRKPPVPSSRSSGGHQERSTGKEYFRSAHPPLRRARVRGQDLPLRDAPLGGGGPPARVRRHDQLVPHCQPRWRTGVDRAWTTAQQLEVAVLVTSVPKAGLEPTARHVLDGRLLRARHIVLTPSSRHVGRCLGGIRHPEPSPQQLTRVHRNVSPRGELTNSLPLLTAFDVSTHPFSRTTHSFSPGALKTTARVLTAAYVSTEAQGGLPPRASLRHIPRIPSCTGDSTPQPWSRP